MPGGHLARSRLRQPLQRHRRVPDRAGPGSGGHRLARARQDGPPLRATPRPVLQPGPHLRQAPQDPGGHPRARGRARPRAPLHTGPPRAPPSARHAQLTSLPLPFYDNPLLFGHDASGGLLAFEPADHAVRIYARRDGGVAVSEEAFRPFLLLADRPLLGGFEGDVEFTPLDGDGVYRWIADCPSWAQALRERDPDVLEGHNVFRFDLEYLEARARRCRVELRWGRDGSALRGYPSRMQVADRTISYRRYAVAGRHIVDTWILAQFYDVAARDLPSYGLKDVARHFGVAAPARTYLPPEDIPRIFRDDPARLLAYARDDVIETLALSALLSPPYFVQAQALP